MHYLYSFQFTDSVSKIVSKLTSLVLSFINLGGLLCIQNLHTAQKVVLTPWNW